MTRCIYRRIMAIGTPGFIDLRSSCVHPDLVARLGYHKNYVKIKSHYVCEDCDLREWDPLKESDDKNAGRIL